MTDEPTRLPVEFKKPPSDDDRLVVVERSGCCHFFVQYIVDPSEAEVTCGKCGAKLNPMWVLHQIANTERRWVEARKSYQSEMKRLDERKRTKCEHCDRMTRISSR